MLRLDPHPSRQTYRVLLVEDDPADAALVRAYLDDAWSIDNAPDLKTAIACLTQRNFDVLLVDLTLPDASRLDAVRRLRMEAPDLPIVVLSGYEDPHLGMRVTQCGAEGFVRKQDLEPGLLVHAILHAREQKLDERRSLYLAAADKLTGLANERRFLDVLRCCLAHESQALAVIRIDIDQLKQINLTHGPDVGDALLQEIAWRLGGLARHTDVVARLRADDFAILLADVAELDVLRGVGKRLVDHLSRPFDLPDGAGDLPFTCSVGIASTHAEGESIEAVLSTAERALVETKASPERVVTVQQVATGREQASTAALAQAFKRGEFVLAYQPQFSFDTDKVTGFEALLRWKPAVGPMVMPSAFIPQLEASDLIIDVGRWVLMTACEQLSRLRKSTGKTPQMAVNVSSRQFQGGDLVKTVIEALETYQIAPAQLELEITERIVMQDCGHTRKTLVALRQLGVKIALDDFGTGYSALSYLNRFPVDILKLDRSLVSCVREVGCGAMIASAIIQLAHNLGMTVVGEGVESAEEAAFLRTEGCDVVQGYFFGRPTLCDSLESHESWVH